MARLRVTLKCGAAAFAVALCCSAASAQSERADFVAYETETHGKIVALAETNGLDISTYHTKRSSILKKRNTALSGGDTLEALKQEALLASLYTDTLEQVTVTPEEWTSHLASVQEDTLSSYKIMCGSGKQPAKAQVSAYQFCRMVIEQSTKRLPDWKIASLKSWSSQYPYEAMEGIKTASLKDERTFRLRRDQDGAWVTAPLNCSYAYEVGFAFGYTNVDLYRSKRIPLDTLVDERDCHNKPDATSTKFGLLLGLRDGVRFAQSVEGGPS